jgi:hypothetical protein
MEGVAYHRLRLALGAGPSSNPGSYVSSAEMTNIEGELKGASREKLLDFRMCNVRMKKIINM